MKAYILVLLIGLSVAVQVQEQSAIQPGGPADLLLDHLSKIETDIRTEQFEHQSLYEKQHAECEEEISHRNKAIADGEDALKRAQAHFTRCDSSLAEARADLEAARAYQIQIRGNIQSLTLKRNQEKQEFKRLIEEELDPAIRAVEGAFPIIEEFYDGASPSFVQITKNMGKTFKSLVKAGHGSKMAGVLTALVSLSQAAGAGFTVQQIDEVKNLFNLLLEDLQTAKSNAIDTENKRQEIFDATVAEYNKLLDKLAATESQLVDYVAEMQACVAEEQGIIDSASSKIRNNKAALEYATEMCNAFETEYENATVGRQNELKLLAKLKDFIKEQADIFGDYGVNDVNVFEDYKKSIQDQANMFIQVRNQKKVEHNNRKLVAF